MRTVTAALLLISALSQPATAAITGNLVFTDPTGTVSATDSIEVWVTLTLDASSDPITYDPYTSFPNGVDPSNIPTDGYSYDQTAYIPFDFYDYIYLFSTLYCDETFSDGCAGPVAEYHDLYNPHPNEWFNFLGTINPGESVDFLWGTWTPINGVAATGSYQLNTVGLGLGIRGTDAFGNELDGTIFEFETDCSAANCTFTRDVITAVPVPAAFWLFGTSVVSLLGMRLRYG